MYFQCTLILQVIMKILLTFFVLLFSSSVFAENASDFEIEGISIGDSLLDHFNKDLIELEKYDEHSLMYKNNEYVQIGASYKDSYRLKIDSDKYDDLSIVLKTNDINYEVFLIGGRIFCNDIDSCKSKKQKIVEELKNFFSNDTEIVNDTGSHPADPTGKSITYETYFYFKDTEDYIFVGIYDWREAIKGSFEDNLKITIVSEKFNNFLREVQYK